MRDNENGRKAHSDRSFINSVDKILFLSLSSIELHEIPREPIIFAKAEESVALFLPPCLQTLGLIPVSVIQVSTFASTTSASSRNLD